MFSGRWPPKDRRLPDSEVLRQIRGELMDFCDRHISKRLFAELACGRHAAAPFEARAVEVSRKKVLGIMASAGFDGVRQPEDQESLVEFRLISAMFEIYGDPDARVFKDYAWGVRIGVQHRMPRTPAVYSASGNLSVRQTRWRTCGGNPPSEL